MCADITIVPPIPLRRLTKLLSNPTVEDLQQCTRVAERETWKSA
jgi:hypothetical protein